jgi:hypothetical protein
MSDTQPSPLIFGIYPGGHTGFGSGRAVTADDPVRIHEALDHLQVGTSPFLVRGYLPYAGSLSATEALAIRTPTAAEQYVQDGRKLDLVLQFRQPDLDGWLTFIRQSIHRYNSMLATLQITEEANVTTTPEVDGCIPQVREALVRGVIAAKEEIQRCGLDIQVGFNAAPSFDPADDFWPAISALGGQSFLDALDYVGLDFFPDVFRPLPDAREATLRRAVVGVLSHFRNVSLAAGNISQTCPIHITEHGCPTGPTRSAERQVEMVEQIVRIIHEQREQLNITHYEHFALRDANSSNSDLLSQFGLLRDDYHPKPAFERYRQLIADLGRAVPTK